MRFSYRSLLRLLLIRIDMVIPVPLRTDPDSIRRTRLLISSSLFVGFASVGLAGIRFTLEGSHSPVGRILLVVGTATLLLPLLIRITSWVRACGILLPMIGLFGGTTMALQEGGLYSEAISWVVLVPLVAALFAGAGGAILLGGLGLFCLTFLLFAQHATLDFPWDHPNVQELLLHFFGSGSALVFSAGLGWFHEHNRLRAQKALRTSERRHRSLLSALPDLVFRMDLSGRILDLQTPQGGFLPFAGRLDPSRLLHEALPPDTASVILRQAKSAVTAGMLISGEVQLEGPLGTRDIEVRVVPGEGDQVVAVVRDLTDKNRAARMKDEFISVVSHELRTPLTSIHGALRLLEASVGGELSDQGNTLVRLAERNSRRLGELIDDLLDLQRLEEGRMLFNYESIEISRLLTEAVELNGIYAREYDIGLALGDHPRGAHIWIDKSRTQQILANLISNAIKVSPKKAKIDIDAALAESDRLRIHIRDRGPGIPTEFKKSVFEKFTQIDGSHTRRVGGSGLGLAISKRLVETMHGYLQFQDRPGGGTIFTIDLPSTSTPSPNQSEPILK